MKIIKKEQKGAAAIIASIVVATGILSIVLSTTIIALNDRAGLNSFANSMKNFYAAEAGVGEALMQLRKEPSNLIFNNLTINGVSVDNEFIESGACEYGENCSILEATASSTDATRKIRYACDNQIANCGWSELTP